MRHIAIVGSGPAGFYTAEAALKTWNEAVRVDIIDRLPVPYGLIRSGVAPDHQSIKAVAKRYEAVATDPRVRFIGHVVVGRDVSVATLTDTYDAVVLATGAPDDRALGIPGDDLPGVIGSSAFVGWYNAHPDFAGLVPPLGGRHAVIVGNGNVALDVARILAKARDEFDGSDIAGHALDAVCASGLARITILGRRGPYQIAMTAKELGELGHLSSAQPHVDTADLPPAEGDAALEPGLRKSVGHLRSFAAAPPRDGVKSVTFDFFAAPCAIEGDGHARAIVVERTQLGADGRAVATGETYRLPADLIVACIGYRTPQIAGVPYDEAGGRFANENGRISPGLYCVGWAKRGPSGTIGTNRPDGQAVIAAIAADQPEATGKPGGVALDALLAAGNIHATDFAHWQRIDAAEIARARTTAPREKFTDVAAMLSLTC